MSVFSKLKQFQQMREQAKKIEDVLGNEKIEVDGARGMIKMVMNGKQEIVSLTIDPSFMQSDKIQLESALRQTFNDAIHKVQKMMAGKIKDMGGLNMPGMQ